MQKITTESWVNVVKFADTIRTTQGLLFRNENGYIKIYNYDDEKETSWFITMIKQENFADMIEFLSINKE